MLATVCLIPSVMELKAMMRRECSLGREKGFTFVTFERSVV
jgi:hypothetical protein